MWKVVLPALCESMIVELQLRVLVFFEKVVFVLVLLLPHAAVA